MPRVRCRQAFFTCTYLLRFRPQGVAVLFLVSTFLHLLDTSVVSLMYRNIAVRRYYCKLEPIRLYV